MWLEILALVPAAAHALFDNTPWFSGKAWVALGAGVVFLFCALFPLKLPVHTRRLSLVVGAYLVIVMFLGWIPGLVAMTGLGMLYRDTRAELQFRDWKPLKFSLAIVGVTVFSVVLSSRFVNLHWEDWIGPFRSLESWQFVMYGIVWSVLNSLFEEIFYRHIFWKAFHLGHGQHLRTNIVQAVIFGLGHWIFFNNLFLCLGISVWAFAIGELRHRSGGLFWPVLVHLGTDLCILALAISAR